MYIRKTIKGLDLIRFRSDRSDNKRVNAYSKATRRAKREILCCLFRRVKQRSKVKTVFLLFRVELDSDADVENKLLSVAILNIAY